MLAKYVWYVLLSIIQVCMAADTPIQRILTEYPMVPTEFFHFLEPKPTKPNFLQPQPTKPNTILHTIIKTPKGISCFIHTSADNQTTPIKNICANLANLIHHDEMQAPLDLDKVERLADYFKKFWQLPKYVPSPVSFSCFMLLMDAEHLFRIDMSCTKNNAVRSTELHARNIANIAKQKTYLLYIDRGAFEYNIYQVNDTSQKRIDAIAQTCWEKDYQDRIKQKKSPEKKGLLLLNVAELKKLMDPTQKETT